MRTAYYNILLAKSIKSKLVLYARSDCWLMLVEHFSTSYLVDKDGHFATGMSL